MCLIERLCANETGGTDTNRSARLCEVICTQLANMGVLSKVTLTKTDGIRVRFNTLFNKLWDHCSEVVAKTQAPRITPAASEEHVRSVFPITNINDWFQTSRYEKEFHEREVGFRVPSISFFSPTPNKNPTLTLTPVQT